MNLTLIQGHRSVRKQKLLQLSHKSFQLIWMEFCILLRLVRMMNFLLILSQPFSFQGREPYLHDFIKKEPLTFGWYLDVYWLISLKLGMMIEITTLYILRSVWMTLTFSEGHSCYRKARTCVLILLWSCMKQHKCSWWLIVEEGWLWSSPASMANMYCLSICSSYYHLVESLFCWPAEKNSTI